MAELEPLARRILELRLSDYRLDEIATLTKRNEKTIRRILDDLQTRLERLLLEPGDDIPHGQPVRRQSIREEVPELTDDDVVRDVEPAPSDQPPAFLSDRDFVVQVHLGSGGTGRVYRALHKSSSQLVALKMLKKASQRDPSAVARFLEEARTVASLDHPGIVKVRGIGRTRAGGYFLIQDLVHGQNLGQVRAGRQVDVLLARRWVAEAAEAIDHAHRHGVIHCDLKPGNLLLDAEGHVRVTDFGLATIVRRGAATRPTIAGTMGYMAPEQLDPCWGPIGPWTDVFGLGAVLFSILTGHAPFSGKSVAELLHTMFETSPLLSLQKHRPEVPPELDAICRKCLALAPADRFATAAELAQALRAQT
jgi:serine/threonine-protein kinase